MKILLYFIVAMTCFIVACTIDNPPTSSSNSTAPKEENIQQVIYKLCIEKGGVPIVDKSTEVIDCIFKENRTNSWE